MIHLYLDIKKEVDARNKRNIEILTERSIYEPKGKKLIFKTKLYGKNTFKPNIFNETDKIDKTNSKSIKRCMKNSPWPSRISTEFERLNRFMDRCSDVASILKTTIDFNLLSNAANIGGTGSVTLDSMVNEISVSYSILMDNFVKNSYSWLNIDDVSICFEEHFFTYRVYVKDLQMQLVDIVYSAFLSCETIPARLKFYHIYYDIDLFDSDDILKADKELLKSILNDLEYTYTLFKQENIFINYKMSNYLNKLFWINSLIERLDCFFIKMKKLRPSCFHTDDGWTLRDRHNVIKTKFLEYKSNLLDTWMEGIDLNMIKYLKEPIIIRNEDYLMDNIQLNHNNSIGNLENDLDLKTEKAIDDIKNFEPIDLVEPVKCTKFTVNLNKNVSLFLEEKKYIMDLFNIEQFQFSESVISFAETIDKIVNFEKNYAILINTIFLYNQSLNSLNDNEFDIFNIIICKIDNMLKEGCDKICWISYNCTDYISSISNIIENTFLDKLSVLKSVTKKIYTISGNLCDGIVNVFQDIGINVYQKEKETIKIINLESIVKRHNEIEQEFDVIHETINSKLHNNLMHLFNVLEISESSPSWIKYIDYVENIVYNGITNYLRITLTNCLSFLTNQKDFIIDNTLETSDRYNKSGRSTGPSELVEFPICIQIDLNLIEGEPIFIPSLNENFVSQTLLDVFKMIIESHIKRCSYVSVTNEKNKYIKNLDNNSLLNITIQNIIENVKRVTHRCTKELRNFNKYNFIYRVDPHVEFYNFLNGNIYESEFRETVKDKHKKTMIYKIESAASSRSNHKPVLSKPILLENEIENDNDPSLSEFSIELELLKESLKSITQNHQNYNVRWGHLNFVPIVESTSVIIRKRTWIYLNYLEKLCSNYLCQMDTFLTKVEPQIEIVQDSNVDKNKLKSIIGVFNQVNTEKQNMDERFPLLQKTVDLIESYNYNLNSSTQLLYDNAIERWNNIKKNMAIAKKYVGIAIQTQSADIIDELNNYNLRLQNISKRLKNPHLYSADLLDTIFEKYSIGHENLNKSINAKYTETPQNCDYQQNFNQSGVSNISNTSNFSIDLCNEKLNASDKRIILFEINKDYQLLINDSHDIEQLQQLIEVESISFDKLRCIGELIDDLIRTFSLCDVINRRHKVWISQCVVKINLEEIDHECDQQLCDISQLNNEILQWPFVKKCNLNVENIKKYLNIITAVSKSDMKTRHWKQIFLLSNQKNITFTPFADHTLGQLMLLKLENYMDNILDVVKKSHKDEELENKLKNYEADWLSSVFYLQPCFMNYLIIGKPDTYTPKNMNSITTDEKVNSTQNFKRRASSMIGLNIIKECGNTTLSYQLKNTKKLFLKLNKHHRELAKLFKSTLSGSFADQIYTWKNNLKIIEEILHIWLKFAERFRKINQIMKNNEIYETLKKKCTQFCYINNEYNGFMQHVYEFPNIMKICFKKNLKRFFFHLGDKLKMCEIAIEKMLIAKRSEFPRLYFVSNTTLINVFSGGLDVEIMNRYIYLLFPNIKYLDYQLIQNDTKIASNVNGVLTALFQINSIYMQNGDILELGIPVICNINVDSWLSQLECSVTLALKTQLIFVLNFDDNPVKSIICGDDLNDNNQCSIKSNEEEAHSILYPYSVLYNNIIRNRKSINSLLENESLVNDDRNLSQIESPMNDHVEIKENNESLKEYLIENIGVERYNYFDTDTFLSILNATGQILNLFLKIKLTKLIDIHFVNSFNIENEEDKNQIEKPNIPQYNALNYTDHLILVISMMINYNKQNSNNYSTPTLLYKLMNSLSLLLYYKEIASNGTKAVDTISDEYFKWQSSLKYYHNVNTINIRVMTFTFTYQFELVDSKNDILSSSHSNKFVWFIIHAIQSYQPLQIGMKQMQLLKQLSYAFGVLMKVVYLDETTTQERIRNLLKGLCSTGAWIAFNNMDELDTLLLCKLVKNIEMICSLLKSNDSEENHVYENIHLKKNLFPICIKNTWKKDCIQKKYSWQKKQIENFFRPIDLIQFDFSHRLKLYLNIKCFREVSIIVDWFIDVYNWLKLYPLHLSECAMETEKYLTKLSQDFEFITLSQTIIDLADMMLVQSKKYNENVLIDNIEIRFIYTSFKYIIMPRLGEEYFNHMNTQLIKNLKFDTTTNLIEQLFLEFMSQLKLPLENENINSPINPMCINNNVNRLHYNESCVKVETILDQNEKIMLKIYKNEINEKIQKLSLYKNLFQNIIIVGPTLSGKSTSIEIWKWYELTNNVNFGIEKVYLHSIHDKELKNKILNNELEKLIEICFNEGFSKHQVLHIDGFVDSNLTCLIDNFNIPKYSIDKNLINVLLETDQLHNIDPGFLSKCGIIFYKKNEFDRSLNELKLEICEMFTDESKTIKVLHALIDGLVTDFVIYIDEVIFSQRNTEDNISNITSNLSVIVKTAIVIFKNIYTSRHRKENNKDELLFILSFIWSITCILESKELDIMILWINKYVVNRYPQLENKSVYEYVEIIFSKKWSNSLKSQNYSVDDSGDVFVNTSLTLWVFFLMDIFEDSKYSTFISGNPLSGKSKILQNRMKISFMDNFSKNNAFYVQSNRYLTCGFLQKKINDYIYWQYSNIYMPNVNSVLVCFIDDIYMAKNPNNDTLVEFIRSHLDNQTYYDIERKRRIIVDNVNYVVSSSQTHNDVKCSYNPRFLRHFCHIRLPDINEDMIFSILRGITEFNFDKNVERSEDFGNLNLELNECVNFLIKASINLSYKLKSLYLIDWRRLTYNFTIVPLVVIFKNLCLSSDRNTTCLSLCEKWRNEVDWTFGYSLISEIDTNLFNEARNKCIKSLFSDENIIRVLTTTDFKLYSNLLHLKKELKTNIKNTINSEKTLDNYVKIKNIDELINFIYENIQEYNKIKLNIDITLFEPYVHIISRICRILNSPWSLGHLWICAIGSIGKTVNIIRLSSYIVGFDISHYSNPMDSIKDDDIFKHFKSFIFKNLVVSGVNNQPLVLLIDDEKINIYEPCIHYISQILSNISSFESILNVDDITNIINSIRTELSQIGISYDHESAWNFFIKNVKKNLRIIILSNNYEKAIHNGKNECTSILTKLQLIYLRNWNKKELIDGCYHYMESKITFSSASVKKNLAHVLTNMHLSIREQDERNCNKTLNNITFERLIKLFVNTINKRFQLISKEHNDALKMVKIYDERNKRLILMKSQLNHDEIILKQKTKSCNLILVQLGQDNVILSRYKQIYLVQSSKIYKLKSILPKYQMKHERAVYKIVAIASDTKALVKKLQIESLLEIRAAQKPSYHVETLLAAIIMLKGSNSNITWQKGAKRLMSNLERFIEDLISFDNNKILLSSYKEVIKFVGLKQDAFKIFELTDEDSVDTIFILYKWLMGVLRYYDIMFNTIKPLFDKINYTTEKIENIKKKQAILEVKQMELKNRKNLMKHSFEQATIDKIEQIKAYNLVKESLNSDLKKKAIIVQEENRIKQIINSYNFRISGMFGSAAIISGLQVYLGPYDSLFRKKILSIFWPACLREFGLSLEIDHIDSVYGRKLNWYIPQLKTCSIYGAPSPVSTISNSVNIESVSSGQFFRSMLSSMNQSKSNLNSSNRSENINNSTPYDIDEACQYLDKNEINNKSAITDHQYECFLVELIQFQVPYIVYSNWLTKGYSLNEMLSLCIIWNGKLRSAIFSNAPRHIIEEVKQWFDQNSVQEFQFTGSNMDILLVDIEKSISSGKTLFLNAETNQIDNILLPILVYEKSQSEYKNMVSIINLRNHEIIYNHNFNLILNIRDNYTLKNCNNSKYKHKLSNVAKVTCNVIDFKMSVTDLYEFFSNYIFNNIFPEIILKKKKLLQNVNTLKMYMEMCHQNISDIIDTIFIDMNVNSHKNEAIDQSIHKIYEKNIRKFNKKFFEIERILKKKHIAYENHTREKNTLVIIDEYKNELRIIIHCFTYFYLLLQSFSKVNVMYKYSLVNYLEMVHRFCTIVKKSSIFKNLDIPLGCETENAKKQLNDNDAFDIQNDSLFDNSTGEVDTSHVSSPFDQTSSFKSADFTQINENFTTTVLKQLYCYLLTEYEASFTVQDFKFFQIISGAILFHLLDEISSDELNIVAYGVKYIYDDKLTLDHFEMDGNPPTWLNAEKWQKILSLSRLDGNFNLICEQFIEGSPNEAIWKEWYMSSEPENDVFVEPREIKSNADHDIFNIGGWNIFEKLILIEAIRFDRYKHMLNNMSQNLKNYKNSNIFIFDDNQNESNEKNENVASDFSINMINNNTIQLIIDKYDNVNDVSLILNRISEKLSIKCEKFSLIDLSLSFYYKENVKKFSNLKSLILENKWIIIENFEYISRDSFNELRNIISENTQSIFWIIKNEFNSTSLIEKNNWIDFKSISIKLILKKFENKDIDIDEDNFFIILTNYVSKYKMIYSSDNSNDNIGVNEMNYISTYSSRLVYFVFVLYVIVEKMLKNSKNFIFVNNIYSNFYIIPYAINLLYTFIIRLKYDTKESQEFNETVGQENVAQQQNLDICSLDKTIKQQFIEIMNNCFVKLVHDYDEIIIRYIVNEMADNIIDYNMINILNTSLCMPEVTDDFEKWLYNITDDFSMDRFITDQYDNDEKNQIKLAELSSNEHLNKIGIISSCLKCDNTPELKINFMQPDAAVINLIPYIGILMNFFSDILEELPEQMYMFDGGTYTNEIDKNTFLWLNDEMRSFNKLILNIKNDSKTIKKKIVVSLKHLDYRQMYICRCLIDFNLPLYWTYHDEFCQFEIMAYIKVLAEYRKFLTNFNIKFKRCSTKCGIKSRKFQRDDSSVKIKHQEKSISDIDSITMLKAEFGICFSSIDMAFMTQLNRFLSLYNTSLVIYAIPIISNSVLNGQNVILSNYWSRNYQWNYETNKFIYKNLLTISQNVPKLLLISEKPNDGEFIQIYVYRSNSRNDVVAKFLFNKNIWKTGITSNDSDNEVSDHATIQPCLILSNFDKKTNSIKKCINKKLSLVIENYKSVYSNVTKNNFSSSKNSENYNESYMKYNNKNKEVTENRYEVNKYNNGNVRCNSGSGDSEMNIIDDESFNAENILKIQNMNTSLNSIKTTHHPDDGFKSELDINDLKSSENNALEFQHDSIISDKPPTETASEDFNIEKIL
ncbi:hypothetical protein A3Q56_01270 [Intoshia linei]|uniref:Uncharacterized protein n=1 Tax=Intoshia linei TaxID=1819745 RepID=A0A177B9Q6_9BILA|nr:hypothetical protein A3Q56_01270 [Intoshia linei]